MKSDSQEKVQSLINQLDKMINSAFDYEKEFDHEIGKVLPQHKKSAYNLVHYLSVRSRDIRDLQNALGQMGVSRLGKAEGHVMSSLLAIRETLKCLSDTNQDTPEVDNYDLFPSFKDEEKILKKNTNLLLGKKVKGSSARIMVTMPSEVATNPKMAKKMSKAGMNIARINCAHDHPEVWEQMILNLKEGAKKEKRGIRISMDLGGPKLRTGNLPPGPKVKRLRPVRDDLGRIIKFPKVFLGKRDPYLSTEQPYVFLPMDLRKEDIQVEDLMSFIDTRGKNCSLKVTQVEEKGTWAECNKSAYVYTGMQLKHYRTGKRFVMGELPPIPQSITLKPGDILYIVPEIQEELHLKMDIGGAHVIPCPVPEIFNQVKPGEKIIFDDDKIETVIRETKPNMISVEVIYAVNGAAKLRSEKGMNFPDSQLNIRGLTDKDKEDLKFVVKHADVVNLSFVNVKDDIQELFDELQSLERTDIGIILKIETLSGYKNLPRIILKAMQFPAVGVMLARGDLAIEVGWENLAYVQEEIMRLCEASHVPLIWATQVLETQAKKGRPSRAEISDVIMAERAECVMLNKGPHIEETIKSLDGIMKSMEAYQRKKATLLPALNIN